MSAATLKPAAASRLCGFIEHIRVDVGQKHMRAFACQGLCRRKANAARRASDDRNPSIETHTKTSSFQAA